MQADGKAWLYVPSGLTDGPLPTHYEPQESPVPNLLYGQQRNPARADHHEGEGRPLQPQRRRAGQHRSSRTRVTTYRLTEHHTAGGMSRWLPYLSELQPEFFCEVAPELARERGLEHLGWATIVTARGAVEARVMVTDRMVPVRVEAGSCTRSACPTTGAATGISTGDTANDLSHLSLDPNVHIQEVKALTCDIRPGRRPRGPALLDLVADYRRPRRRDRRDRDLAP